MAYLPGLYDTRKKSNDTKDNWGEYDKKYSSLPAAPAAEEQGFGADMVDKFQEGFYNTTGSIGTGLRGVFTDNQDQWNWEASQYNAAKGQQDTLSTAQKEADAKLGFGEGDELNLRNVSGLVSSGMGSLLPSAIGGGVPGAILKKGATMLAPAAATAQKVAQGAGYAAGGAVQIGGATKNQVSEEIGRMSPDNLMMMPDFKAMVDSGVPFEQARKQFGYDQSQKGLTQGGILGAVSMGTLGPVLERIVMGSLGKTAITKTLGGAGTEGVQEFIEEGGQQRIANPLTGKENWEGVLEGATLGAIGGMGAGGIAGGAGAMLQPRTPGDPEIKDDQGNTIGYRDQKTGEKYSPIDMSQGADLPMSDVNLLNNSLPSPKNMGHAPVQTQGSTFGGPGFEQESPSTVQNPTPNKVVPDTGTMSDALNKTAGTELEPTVIPMGRDGGKELSERALNKTAGTELEPTVIPMGRDGGKELSERALNGMEPQGEVLEGELMGGELATQGKGAQPALELDAIEGEFTELQDGEQQVQMALDKGMITSEDANNSFQYIENRRAELNEVLKNVPAKQPQKSTTDTERGGDQQLVENQAGKTPDFKENQDRIATQYALDKKAPKKGPFEQPTDTIGKNERGEDIYQDENGKRFIKGVEGAKGQNKQYEMDNYRGDRFQTPDEIKAGKSKTPDEKLKTHDSTDPAYDKAYLEAGMNDRDTMTPEEVYNRKSKYNLEQYANEISSANTDKDKIDYLSGSISQDIDMYVDDNSITKSDAGKLEQMIDDDLFKYHKDLLESFREKTPKKYEKFLPDADKKVEEEETFDIEKEADKQIEQRKESAMIDPDELNKKTVSELRELAGKGGISKTGNKATLIDKIVAHNKAKTPASVAGKKSDQFNSYKTAIEGLDRGISQGLAQEIKLDERLNDGEADELLKLDRQKLVDKKKKSVGKLSDDQLKAKLEDAKKKQKNFDAMGITIDADFASVPMIEGEIKKREETTEEVATETDMPKKNWAIVRNGQVLTSGGSFGTSKEYVDNLAEQYGDDAQVLYSHESFTKAQDITEGLIVGKTWEEIQGLQQRKPINRQNENVIPSDASPEKDAQGRTDAQKEAGNYKKIHKQWNGLDISIENAEGTVRSGTDEDGKAWEVTMQNDYGDIKGTVAADGENMDVFMGPNLSSSKIYVVNQNKADGSFDEHKIMTGFNSKEAAEKGYLANYEKGWKQYSDLTETTVEGLKTWFKEGNPKERTKFEEGVKTAPPVKQPEQTPEDVKQGKAEEIIVPDKLDKAEAAIDKKIDDVAAKLAAKLLKNRGTLNAGVDPEILLLGAELGALYIGKGAVSFAQYSRSIINKLKEFGIKPNEITPALKEMYAATQMTVSDTDLDKMDDIKTVRKFDLKTLEGDENVSGTAENLERDSERAGNDNEQMVDIVQGETGKDRPAADTTVKEDEVGQVDSGNLSGTSTTIGAKTRSTTVRAEKPAPNKGITGDIDGGRTDSNGTTGQERDADKEPREVIESSPLAKELPLLYPEQLADVEFAEARLKDHQGVMFTNGTGTGKTFSGMGVIKRFANKGKENILIIVPGENVLQSWIDTGRLHDLDVTQLTGITDAGTGISITTYANLGQNNELVNRDFDLIVSDESHKLMENQAGNPTSSLDKFRALTGHKSGSHAYGYAKESELVQEIDALRKEIKEKTDSPEDNTHLDKKLSTLTRRLTDRLIDHVDNRAKHWKDKKTKSVFLSATPFAYVKNTPYAEGFLFDYPAVEQSSAYNAPDDRESFFIENFGFRMRFGKLTEPEAGVESGLMEREFNEKLKETGAISGRRLSVDKDYSREFILIDDAIGNKIDEGFSWIWGQSRNKYLNDHLKLAYGNLSEALDKQFTYHNRIRLLEAIKARHAIPRIKKHLELNRKIVIFHSRIQGGSVHPFSKPISGDTLIRDAYADFKQKRPDLVNLDLNNLINPIVLMKNEFDGIITFYNGTVSKKDKKRNPDMFNDDQNDIKIIMVQDDAGKEGISLHDTTGKHQRVQVNLGLPTKPTQEIQIEGRTYRVGQASDAPFELFNTGTNFERFAFATKIAERASTAENLALGNESRGLKESFIDKFENPNSNDPSTDQGKGGKDEDFRDQVSSPFEKAKTYYYGQQKNTKSRSNREGKDYFATPEPLGLKMVEWADIGKNERVLEPSAGHGAIARFFPELSNVTVIEPSQNLSSKLALRIDGKLITDDFESHNIINKYDAIVMNPPYGMGGSTSTMHVDKAISHLHDGGRIVALLPDGPAANKKLHYLLKERENIYIVKTIGMPGVTFERAGTSVRTKIVILEKQLNPDNAPDEMGESEVSAENIGQFFDNIENIKVKPRNEPDVKVKPKPKIKPKPVIATRQYELTKHTKTDADMHIVKLGKSLDRDNYLKIKQEANSFGGYWNKFKKAFVFESAEEANKFVNNDDLSRVTKQNVVEHEDFSFTGVSKPAGLTEKDILSIINKKYGKPLSGDSKFKNLNIINDKDQKWRGKFSPSSGIVSINAYYLSKDDAVRILHHEKIHQYIKYKTNKKLRKIGDKILAKGKKYPNSAAGKALEIAKRRVPKDHPEYERKIYEETLAYLIQYYNKPGHSSVLKEFLNFIRKIFADTFNMFMNEADAVDYVAKMVKAESVNFEKAEQTKFDTAEEIEIKGVAEDYAVSGEPFVSKKMPKVITNKINNLIKEEKILSGKVDKAYESGRLIIAKKLDAKLADVRENLDSVVAQAESDYELSDNNTEFVPNEDIEVSEDEDLIDIWGNYKRKRGYLADNKNELIMLARGAMNNNTSLTDNEVFNMVKKAGERQKSIIKGHKGVAEDYSTLDDNVSIREEVNQGRNKDTIGEMYGKFKKNLTAKIRQGLVDRYDALFEMDKKLYGKDVVHENTSLSSWVLAKMSTSSQGSVHAMIDYGRIKMDDNGALDLRKGKQKSIVEVLRQLGSGTEINDFMTWIAANRGERLYLEGWNPSKGPKSEYQGGRENLFSWEQIQEGKAFNKGKEKLWNDVLQEFDQFRKDVLDISQKSGIISKEQAADFANEMYVPFYRVMSEDQIAAGAIPGRKDAGRLSRAEAYKKLKGGKEKIGDLLENTLMNYNHLLSASLKNNAAARALKTASHKDVDIAVRVPEKLAVTGKATFIMEDGKKVWYNIDDKLVYNALVSLTDLGMNQGLMKAMRSFKRVFTAATTASPQFIAANFMRDSVHAAAIGKKTMSNNAATGFLNFNNNNRNKQRMIASGGAFSFGHIYMDDPDAIKRQIDRDFRNANLLTKPKHVGDVILKGWDKYQEISNRAENANRMAVYEQALKDGKSHQQASFEARDLLDFSSRGEWAAIRVLTDIVPFLNARLQGLDVMTRKGIVPTIKTVFGKGTDSDKVIAKRFGIVSGAVILASMALYMAYKDDEDFKKLEDWQRDTYWFFKIGDNKFFIPKPFEIGAMGTMAERTLEQFVDNKVTGDLFAERFKEMLLTTFSFNPTPQMIKPIYDVYANRDSFTGRNIETQAMKNLSPENRERSMTTSLAKNTSSALQSLFGGDSGATLSPIQVDFLIKNYLGWVGASASGFIDNLINFGERPEKYWHEYQPIKRFYQSGESNYSKYTTQFYDNMKEVNRVYADIRHFAELGKLDKARELASTNRDSLPYRKIMNRVSKKLTAANKEMVRIRRSNLSQADKRRQIDALQHYKNTLTSKFKDI